MQGFLRMWGPATGLLDLLNGQRPRDGVVSESVSEWSVKMQNSIYREMVVKIIHQRLQTILCYKCFIHCKTILLCCLITAGSSETAQVRKEIYAYK